MDKITLINIHKILIYIRLDIKRKSNLTIVESMIESVSQKQSNNQFVDNLLRYLRINDCDKKAKNELSKLLDKSNYGQTIKDEKSYLEIIDHLFYALKDLLISEMYSVAYDYVDAVHILPGIMINPNRNSINDFWDIYIAPFEEKWGYVLFDELKLFFENICLD